MALTTYKNRPLNSMAAATLESAKRDLLNGALLIVNHHKTTDDFYHFTAHIVANVNGEQRLYGITIPLIATGFVGKTRADSSGYYLGKAARGGRSVGGEVANTVGLVLGIDPYKFNTATLS